MLRSDAYLPAAAKLKVDRRMTRSSDTADTPAKPQDYAGLRAELATLVDDFTPLISKLWPRLEDHNTGGNCIAIATSPRKSRGSLGR